MRLRCGITWLAAFVALSGCYGTKVPPPQHSVLSPIGASTAVRRPVTLPDSLAELLATYRAYLVDEAHHLPPDMASHYAEVELLTLASSYEGRDAELRTVITRRMSPLFTGGPQAGQSPQRHGAFPVDPRDVEGSR